MEPSDHQVIPEGIAAVAITVAEMGGSKHDIIAQVAATMDAVGVHDPAVVREAAAALTRFPQPLDESPETIELAAPVREMLNVPSAASQLEAALRAREALEDFAIAIESRGGE